MQKGRETGTRRVMVIDDHPPMRAGLGLLLDSMDGVEMVAEAGTAKEALEILRRENDVDLLLLDLMLPDAGALELLPRIRRLRSGLPVLVVSMCDQEAWAGRALASGASGYIMKSASVDEIQAAVRTVLDGRVFLSQDALGALSPGTEASSWGSASSTLSQREQQVFELVGRGYLTKAIADELGFSSRTVETYCRRIMAKSGIKGMASLRKHASRDVRGTYQRSRGARDSCQIPRDA